MNLLQKQGFYNSLILYAGTALGFFNLIILFQRVLSIEEIGFFSLMNAIAILYAQVASLGITNVILKYLPYYRSEDKKHAGFISFVILWCAVSFVTLTIVFLVFQQSIIDYYKTQKGASLLIKYFYYTIPLSFLTMVYTVVESLAITIFRNILSSFLREVLLRIFSSVSVLLIAVSVFNYTDFIKVYIVGNLLIVVILLNSLSRKQEFKIGAISGALWGRKKELFKYGVFTLLSGTSFALLQNLDNIMLVSITKDLKVIGIYSTFFAIAMVISLPAKALNRTSVQIIAQAWAQNDLQKIGRIYYKTSVMQMLVGCFLFIGLVINKDFIIMLLHKPDYSEYFNVFVIVGLAFLADITGGINGYIINLSKYYKFTTYFIVSAVIICAVANWVLIPKFGMMGAAIAYLVSVLVLNFMYWLYLKMKFQLQPFTKTHLLIILIIFITLTINLIVPDINNVWINMALRSFVAGVCYLLLTYILRISEDITAMVNKLLKFGRV